MSDDSVNTIVSITGITPEQATHFLEAAGGDVNLAIDLATEGGKTSQPSQPNQPSQLNQPNQPNQTNQTNQNQTNQSNQSQPRQTKGSNRTGGIVGFSDIREPEQKDDKNQAYYAGGEKSGIQILGGPKKEGNKDSIEEFFENAKKAGAVDKSSLPKEEKEKFAGSGYTLGNTAKPTQVVPPKSNTGPMTVNLTFYQDCFTVNDGPPRKLDDPVNKAFLDDITNQFVPRELEELAGGKDVELNIIQKNEEYKPPPKPKVVAFSGQGQTLSTSGGSGSKAQAREITVNENQPVTTIQIRLLDGTRLVAKFNHTHTVGDIRSHIEAKFPTGKPFELRTSYPPKLLANDNATIAEEKLQNASLIQK